MKIGKLRATVAMLGLVVAIAVVQLASPGAAQARCAGNAPTTSTLILDNGETVVSEQPLILTCNNNGTYQGRARSEAVLFFASVWIQNNNVWTVYGGGSEPNTGWWDYSYFDANSYSYMSLCLSTIHPDVFLGTGTWWCGWGTKVKKYVGYNRYTLPAPVIYGVNSGF